MDFFLFLMLLVLLCFGAHFAWTARLGQIKPVLAGVAVLVCVIGAVECNLSEMVNVWGVWAWVVVWARAEKHALTRLNPFIQVF